ncbi:Carboxymethylenebutenolidase [Candidatus Entotheonellaceae bacterium PAL068K]
MYAPEIQSDTIQYSSQDGTQIDAYYSRPVASGTYPGVLVIMEAFGLVDHIKDVARRFAEAGYLAIAPNMYTREGSPDPTSMDQVLQTMFSVPDTQAVVDLDGAAVYLKGQSDSNGKVGVIGFCSGGRYALIIGCKSSNVDACVDSAGGFIIQDEHTTQRPVSPIDMVPTLNCPLLGLFGEEDANPSPEHAARLQEALETHGKTYEFRMYRQAGHAFFADYRPSYRAAAAQDMWHRVMLFYDKYLKA